MAGDSKRRSLDLEGESPGRARQGKKPGRSTLVRAFIGRRSPGQARRGEKEPASSTVVHASVFMSEQDPWGTVDIELRVTMEERGPNEPCPHCGLPRPPVNTQVSLRRSPADKGEGERQQGAGPRGREAPPQEPASPSRRKQQGGRPGSRVRLCRCRKP